MKNCARAVLLLAILVPIGLFAQTDTVNVASDFGVGEGSLNRAIQERIDAGTLSSAVFKLEPYGLYIVTGTITVPAGQRLTLVAPDPGTTQESAPPMLVWTPAAGVDRTFYFNAFGDLYFKNIWILYATTNTAGEGTQVGTEISISQDTTDNLNIAEFENVIFDYCNIGGGGGAVTVATSHARLKFTGCYFRNLTDTHFRYYGRPVSYRFNTTGYHIDKVTFENTTFANFGYGFMQEGGEYADTVIFNHCNFLNGVMFSLQSGWWNWLSVTNSVFVNAFMFGWLDGEIPAGGALNIDSVSTFGFTVPFTDPQRHILFANNSYFIEKWLVDYMTPKGPNNPDGGNVYSDTATGGNIPKPMPMMSEKTKSFFNNKAAFPYMTMMNVHDFEEVGETANPGFLIPPTNIAGIKDYLLRKWTDNSDVNWAFDPNSDVNQSWPMNEQLRYTNATLRAAGMGGFPLGDLSRWWNSQPQIYQNWKAQKDAEYTAIWDLLGNGVTSVEDGDPGIPLAFELTQNYPNPFNPMTQIDYSLPVSGRVSLKVFNVLGTEVATLFEGERGAGTYSATFDGASLASGVYFYRLNVTPGEMREGTVSLTKKLVLLK